MIAACRIFHHKIIEIKAATPTHEEHFELTILTMKFVLVTFLSAVALATLVESQEWIPWNTSKGVPQLQAARGREADYRPLYIIRARKGVDPWIPGKFNADTGKAYIPFNGQELLVTDFEVRCCGSKENVLDFHFFVSFSLEQMSNGSRLRTVKVLKLQLLVASYKVARCFTLAVLPTKIRSLQEKSSPARGECLFLTVD